MSAIHAADQQKIQDAVKKAESLTSGEIRICIEDDCPMDVLDRSAYIFKKLGIHRTKLRNGILIYVSLNDHKYAIIGDAGIHQHVKQHFWDQVGAEMISFFKEGKIADGIVHAIKRSGEKLATHFSYKNNDRNELSDDIFFGDKNS